MEERKKKKGNYISLCQNCCCLIPKLCLILFNPWTVACQAPLSMRLSRQEQWSGLPFPFPEDLPIWGLNLHLLHRQADSLSMSHRGSPRNSQTKLRKYNRALVTVTQVLSMLGTDDQCLIPWLKSYIEDKRSLRSDIHLTYLTRDSHLISSCHWS